MKKIYFSIFIFILTCINYGFVGAYDQEFPSIKLRYGYQYNFFDVFNSSATKKSGINQVTTTFTEKADYNGGTNPSFGYTPGLISAGYIVDAGQSMQVVSSNIPYPISFHPVSRGLKDLEILYGITYYEETSPGVWAGPYTHTEYQPYEITWCGDGVIDNYIDQYSGININETCDPNDVSHTGWGTGGCNVTTCQPINIPNPPVCNNLSVNPLTGNAPLASNVACTGTNATTYTINCGNGQTINANTGTCNYTSTGTFLANCFVDGTITSPACQQTVTVTNTVTTPSCTNLTATPTTGVNSLTSNVVCTGANATTYTINCGNGQTINASTGVCSYATVGTYTPTCYVDGTITSPTCQKSVSVTTTSSSSSSGGGSYQCRDISKSGNQVTCTGNSYVQTFRLNCSGAFMFAPAVAGGNSTTSATFTCNDASASCSVYNQSVNESSFYTWLTNPACNLVPNTGSSSGGSTSSSGGSSSGSPDYCGDGIIQRPNDDFELEECDYGTGTWPAWCTSSCKINGVISFPNDGEIVFGPSDNVIVGNNMNPYSEYSLDKPFILNKSGYDLYFDSLCVVKKSGTTISGGTICQPIGKTLFPGNNFAFSTYPNFVGNTSSLTAGTYGDNILVTTLENKGTLYTNAYFASELKVRVSKPSITTTGGGTSFVNNTSNISNVSNVTQVTGNSNINKNFVGAGVSTGDISSYSTDVTNTTSVDSISQDGQKYNDAVNQATTISGVSLGSTNDLNDFQNYNGITNAFILKNTSFIVNSNTFLGLSGARTYIIENGNLIINSNIAFPDNISFVVKGGNIQIDKTVTSITGTYISIPNGSIGGDIVGINGSTNNVLNVKGSLYGNTQDLISKRTYIKQNSSGLLDVGTIVSFGSSIFRDPAPLTSIFINEYLDSTKVAK